jgi:hypothetical protein
MTAVLDTLPEVATPTIPELLDRLAALGSHKEIALYLAQRGISGTCSNAGLCPIAKYLQQETGRQDISVDEGEIFVWDDDRVYNTTYPVPRVVRDFIAFFDARLHPELIDPELPNNRAVAEKLHPVASPASELPAWKSVSSA